MLSRFSFDAEDPFEEERAEGADERPVSLKSQRKTERRAYMGYIYVSPTTRSDDVTVAWRCKYKSSKRCNGRLYTEGPDGHVLKECGMHCHDPDPTQVEVEQLLDNLRERASASMEDPMQVVSNVLEGASEESQAAGPSKSALRQIIYRVRKDGNQAPVNPEHREDIVVPQSFQTYEYYGTSEQFLLIDSGLGDKDRILVFGRQSLEDVYGAVTTLYADGTFAIAPPLFAQVFTVLGRVGNLVQTFFYVLLPNKTQATYVRALRMISEKYPQFRPTTVCCDYELAVINAMSIVFPGIAINGCFFHLVQCVLRHFSHAQRQRYASVPEFARQVRMILAIAYVPGDRLFEFRDALKEAIQPELLPILAYFEETYIGRRETVVLRVGRGTKHKTVHRRPRYDHSAWGMYQRTIDNSDTTNNHAESAHSRCKTYFGVSHPGLWGFIKALTGVQRLQDYDYNQWIAGHREKAKRKCCLEEKYKNLRNVLDEIDERMPLDFLRGVACVTDTEWCL